MPGDQAIAWPDRKEASRAVAEYMVRTGQVVGGGPAFDDDGAVFQKRDASFS